MTMYRIVLVLMLIMSLGCSNGRSLHKSKAGSVGNDIQQKLGERFETIESPNKKYTLYYQKRDPQDHLNREFRYVVLDNTTQKLIHEGSFIQGYIKWISESELEFTVKSKNTNTESGVLKIDIATINQP